MYNLITVLVTVIPTYKERNARSGASNRINYKHFFFYYITKAGDFLIRLYEVRMELDDNISDLKNKCKKLLGTEFTYFQIVKKSIDARRKSDIYYSCSIDVEPKSSIRGIKKLKYQPVTVKPYKFPECKFDKKIIIVGSGPAGLFAALCLARTGACPLVIERGCDVDKRVKTVNSFFDSAVLNPESNVQFGEGGAGTFSDGKLNTGVNDERIKFVLKEFVNFGAPENILCDSAPHIGTDVLRNVVKNMRKEIERLGGKFLFETRFEEMVLENGKVTAIRTVNTNGETVLIPCEYLILAIGHSARDTIRSLYMSGLNMEKKTFSIGVRIEHRQSMINKALYGSFSNKLPAAPYKLWTHLKDGNSLYTFCMCPGGYVVNAASAKNSIVTNGMSNNDRAGNNANSALLVNVKYKTNNLFEGIELQEELEKKAFIIGGSDYKMPVQLLGDFINSTESCSLGDVEPTVKPGYKFADLNMLLPDYVSNAIKSGISDFERKIHGFSSYDAVLTGPETRSSSPIKIIRDKETLKTNIINVFSAGEGGGHAGGITSSAVDGIKVAEAVAGKYNI